MSLWPGGGDQNGVLIQNEQQKKDHETKWENH